MYAVHTHTHTHTQAHAHTLAEMQITTKQIEKLTISNSPLSVIFLIVIRKERGEDEKG